MRQDIDALRQQAATPAAGDGAVGELDQRVQALSAALEQARTEFTALAAASGQSGSASAMQALDERFKALETAIGTLPQGTAPATDLTPVNDKLAALEAQIAAGATAAADAKAAGAQVSERLAGLEQSVAGLSARIEEEAARPDAALAIAASALKAAVDRGGSFAAEFDTYAAIAPTPADIEPLRALAAGGVASRTTIVQQFPAVAQAMIDAARPRDPNAGIIDKLMDSAQSLVEVRPVGMVQGSDAPAIVARMEVALNKDDYAAALTEFETLPDPAKAAGAEFASTLRARVTADAILGQVVANTAKS